MSKSDNISFEDWSNFFQKIAPIFEKRRIIHDEKRKRGDFFNVFSILGMERKEVETHSAFLAELLNPNGNHGLGDKFLTTFIDTIIPKHLKGFDCNNNTYQVNKECYEGKISEDGEKGGRVDIRIISEHNIIIIENKIDAEDKYKQLTRYKKVAKKANNHCLLYLTLNGKEANDYSTQTNEGEPLVAGEDYYPISYKEDILGWLKKCLEIAVLHSKVRETIAQYIDLIKKLTNMELETINLLLDKENQLYTLKILDARILLEKKIYEKVRKTITEHDSLKHIKWEMDNYSKKYLFRPVGWKIFYFSLEAKYFGLYNKEFDGEDKNGKPFSDQLKELCKDIQLGKLKVENSDGSYPFGYYKIPETTFTELIKDEFANEIVNNIKQIFNDIENNKELSKQIEEGELKNKIGKCLKLENVTLKDCFNFESK